ncbi:MAG: CBS domain-containing protein, partial [Candidatus Aureabacteria bacterium]|nr:CBS domain-containing protein [Candidatus Auribacterota bacterium]
YKMFPVVRDGALLGCVSTGEVKRVPRERWHDTAVHEIMRSCSGENTVRPGDDAMRAIGMMTRTGASRLLVVEGERLVGIVSLKDMLKLLSLKLDLEEDE